MRLAAYFILISAVFHVAICVLSGFSSDAQFLLVPAAIYVLLALALLWSVWGSRWISLVVMLGGAAAAIGSFAAPPVEPSWMFGLIFATDIIAAIFLFGAIWVGHRPTVRAA
ncbi:MAG: hypothetical protein AAFY99_10080 [Pseudomonadota bacterium]